MVRKINSLEFRIFVMAIAASIMIHIFWISAVKIVTGPSGVGCVKFSKVSFLGPASGPGGLSEFKVAPQPTSFLEKRYRKNFVDIPVSGVEGRRVFYDRAAEKGAPAHRDDFTMAPLIEKALE
ncbi:MAG: hypothetical protein V1927_06110 [Candidatus Omnitrophota bacterium]